MTTDREGEDRTPRYAVVEDDDYETEPTRSSEISPVLWLASSPNTNKSLEANLLLVAVSEPARYFVKSSLELAERVAIVLVPKTNPLPHHIESDQHVGSVYRAVSSGNSSISNDVYVVVCDCPIDSSPQVARELIDTFKPKSTIVLDSLSATEFRGGEEYVGSCLRLLETGAAKKAEQQSICPLLQPPTVIQGLSAALISLCERRNLLGQVYMNVFEYIHGESMIDEEGMREYERVVNEGLQKGGLMRKERREAQKGGEKEGGNSLYV